MDREQIDFFKGLKNGLIICAVAWFIILVSIAKCTGQTPGIILNVPIEPKVANPLDVRQKIPTLADTTLIDFVFVGALTYVTSLEKYYIRQPSGWTEFATGKIYRIQNTTLINTVIASVGDYIITDGYYASGDGGGAMYKVESSGTVNSIDIFTNGSNKAKLQTNADGGINLLQLGCSPSLTNNSPRIQKAIDLFDKVYCFLNDTFDIQATLYVKSNLHFELGKATMLRATGANWMLLMATPGITTEVGTTTNLTLKGGIYNHNMDRVPTIGGAFYVDYNILLNKIEHSTISDLTLKNTSKFALSVGDSKYITIKNIKLETNSDGVHIEGAANNIIIDNIYGYSGDDFVALSCANWVPNNYCKGNIEDVSISNIHCEINPNPAKNTGNGVAIFAGNSGFGNPGDTLYHVKNVFVNNVTGFSENASLISILDYGVAGDSTYGTNYGGHIENIFIDNVTGGSLTGAIINISSKTANNINIKNVYSQNATSNITINNIDIDNLKFENIHMEDVLNVTPIVVTNTTLRNFKLDNGFFESDDVNASWINFNNTNSGAKITLENCEFKGLAAYDGRLDVQCPGAELTIKNSEFINAYTAIWYNKDTATNYVTLDDVIFTNVDIAVYNEGDGAVKVYPKKYKTDRTQADAFIEAAAGSIEVINNSYVSDEVINLTANHTIPTNFPKGSVFTFKNKHTASITIGAGGGGLIDGVASITLVENEVITVKKTGSLNYDRLQNDSPASGGVSSTASTNYLTKVNGSGVLVNSGITDDASILAIGNSGHTVLDIGPSSTFDTWFRSTGNIGIGPYPNATDKIKTDGNIYIANNYKGLIVDADGYARAGFMKYTLPTFAVASGESFEFGHVAGADVRDHTGFATAFELKPNGLMLHKPLTSYLTNIVWGANAVVGNTAGSNNINLGYGALSANASGTYNVSLGRDAGNNITSGSGNISIGHSARPANATDSHKLSIGNRSDWGANLINGDLENFTLDVNGKLKYATSSSANASGLVGYATDGYMKNTTIGTGLSLSTAGVLSSTAGSTYWMPFGTNRIYYDKRVAVTNDTTNTGSAYSLIVTPVTGVTDSTARIQIYNGSSGSKKRSELYINGGTSSSLRLTKYGTSESATLFGSNLSTSSVIQGDRHTYINNTGGDNYDLKIGANSIERMTIKGDSGIYLVNLPTGTADSTLAITSDNRVIRIANASGGGGSADLTFSGASSPVTLASSSGTDVTLTAGTNVTFSQASNNLTINATAAAVGGSTGEVLWNNAGTEDGAENILVHNNNLNLDTVSIPSSPSIGTTLFTDAVTKNLMVKTANGDVYSMNNPYEWTLEASYPTGFGVTGVSSLAGAYTLVGATARSYATTNLLTRKERVGLVSAAGAGSLASIRNSAKQSILLGETVSGAKTGGFDIEYTFAVTDASLVSGARMFVGLRNNMSAPTNIDIATASVFGYGFGIGHIASDANFSIYHNGTNASGTPTTIALGSNFPVQLNTIYKVEWDNEAGNNSTVTYRVTNINTGDSTQGTISATSSNFPTQIPMNHSAWRTNNATASAVAFDWLGFSATYTK